MGSEILKVLKNGEVRPAFSGKPKPGKPKSKKSQTRPGRTGNDPRQGMLGNPHIVQSLKGGRSRLTGEGLAWLRAILAVILQELLSEFQSGEAKPGDSAYLGRMRKANDYATLLRKLAKRMGGTFNTNDLYLCSLTHSTVFGIPLDTPPDYFAEELK